MAKESDKALKAMEQVRQHLKDAKAGGSAEPSPGFRMPLGVYPLLRHADIYEQGSDTLGGRPRVTLPFRPRAGWTDPKRRVHNLAGTLWIEAQGKIVALARAWPGSQAPTVGLFFEMYHKKVFGDVWAPVYYRLNPALAPETFLKERFDGSFENSNFQRFPVQPGALTRLANGANPKRRRPGPKPPSGPSRRL